jgi:hypothetical protein
MTFERSKLCRLITCYVTRAQITTERLKNSCGTSNRERDSKSSPVKKIPTIAQHQKGVNAGNNKACSSIRRNCHMDRLRKSHRVKHCGYGVNVDWLTVNQVKTSRSIHPGIGDNYKNA